MKLDLEKWNSDRIAVETAIKELKHLIRHTEREFPDYSYFGWTTSRKIIIKGGTCEDYAQLHKLKAQATDLYVLRAQSRGRVHIQDQPLEARHEVQVP